MSKGIGEVVGFVIVVLLIVVAIGVVLAVGLPILDQARETGIINEARQNMLIVDSLIRQTAAGGVGTLKTLQLKVSDGTYRVDSDLNSVDFEFNMRSGAIPRGTFTREGNLLTIVGGSAEASQNSTHLVIENEVLEIVFSKVGSENSFDGINTSTLLRTARSKVDPTTTVRPSNLGIKVGGIANTSWGIGYSKLAFEGGDLPRASVLAHVRTNTSGIEYEILYTLPASSDFMLVEVRNTTSNETTLTYTYKLGTSSSNDVLRLGSANETTFSPGEDTETASVSNVTLNLDNTNYTKNSSTLTVSLGDTTFVRYNASDGTQRDVSELGEIGQGNWSFSSNSTNTTINFTLAGSDGYEFGVRDSLAGGSYWIHSNGSLYGRINVSNDFITVGLAENNFTIYNSSGKVIFNSSFRDSVKIDNQNLISIYGSGAQNKTVYFFDWTNQSWKVWMRGLTGNSTHGTPDWLDPRNKQAFKWRYAFSLENRNISKPAINFTFLMTAHDSFVRIFADSDSRSPIFKEDFYNCQTNQCDGAWPSGNTTDFSVDTSGDTLVLKETSDSIGRKIYRDLGFTLDDSKFVVRFTAKAGTLASNRDYNFYVTSSNAGTETGQDFLGINMHVSHVVYDGYYRFRGDGICPQWANTGACSAGTENHVDTDGEKFIWGASTTYYLEFARTSATTYEIRRYSSPTYSTLSHSQSFTINSTTQSLRYLTGSARFQSDTTANSMLIDDVKVYNGVSSAGSEPVYGNVTLPISLPENRTSVTTAESGLVGYWNFNEGQGGNFSDVSGNGNTGFFPNGTAWLSSYSCAFGNCFSPSVVGMFGNVSSSSSLTLNKLSISMWFKIASSSRDFTFFSAGGPGMGRGPILEYGGATGGPAYLRIGHFGAGTDLNTAGKPLLANNWYHAVFTIDQGSTQKIYLNGTLYASGSETSSGSMSGPFSIGKRSDLVSGPFFLDGSLDEIKVYSRILDEQEIKQLYITGLNQQKPGIYFTKNNATDNEEVLFATTNFKNINRTTPSNFQIFSNHTNFFGFNYTFNSTQNQNFLFALGTMGRMNTTNFNPQNNASAFSNELIESVANSTMTYYELPGDLLTFGDDLSSYNTQAEADFVWNTSNTSETRANITGDYIDHLFTQGNVNGAIVHDLGLNASDQNWVLRFSILMTSLVQNANLMVGLSDKNQSVQADTSQDFVGINYAYAPSSSVEDLSAIETDNSAPSSEPNGGKRVNLQTGIRYYVEVRRTSATNFTAEIFTDSSFTYSLGSQTDFVPSGVSGLRYIKLMNKKQASNEGRITARIDDVQFFNNATSVEEWKREDKNGLVQHGVTQKFFYDGGAVGIWHLDEGSGLNATDASGNGNIGTLNGPTWVSNSSCRYNSCLSFDGTNDYVQILDRNVLDLTNALTVEAWVRLSSAPTGNSYVFDKSDEPTANDEGYALFLGSFSKFHGWTANSAGTCSSASTTVLSTGSWYHLVFTFDGNKHMLYLNGNYDGTLSCARTPSANTANPRIGSFTGNSNFFPAGFIDEVRIYPRVLKDSEVREHYQREVSRYYDDFGTAAGGKTYDYFGVEDSNTTLQPITPAGAVLHYRFNDNSTTNTTDNSGLGNIGRVNGTGLWITNSSCKSNFGGCMKFNGATKIEVTNEANFDFDANIPYSMSLWVNTIDHSSLAYLWFKRDEGNGDKGYSVSLGSDEKINVIYDSGVPFLQCDSTNALTVGKFQHIVITNNGSSTTNCNGHKIYVDNVPETLVLSQSGTLASTLNNVEPRVAGRISGTNYFGGSLDEVIIVNRTLSADEIYQTYLGGMNRTIAGRWHRVASADDLQSVSYNLTDHNNTFDGQDYDMRIIFVNGSTTNTTTTSQSPSPACYTRQNTSQLFICSYDQSEFSPAKTSGVVYSGDTDDFVSLCNDQADSEYLFNVTGIQSFKSVIPLATATCNVVGNQTRIVEKQGLPSRPFGSYEFRGAAKIQMSLQYDRILINGTANFGAGQHKICIEKIDRQGDNILVGIRDC